MNAKVVYRYVVEICLRLIPFCVRSLIQSWSNPATCWTVAYERFPITNSAQTLLNLAGGVALLLWATRTVRTGIERAYGAGLRRTMARALSGKIQAVLSGLFVSLALQSAAGTVLLAMSLSRAVPC